MFRHGSGPAVGEGLTFVIRGDIISSTGYARAARALARLLARDYAVLGVSLQEDPSDRAEVFPGRLIDDADLPVLARSERLVVINHSTPEHFVPVPGAYNIGLFYWETLAIPRKFYWQEYIAAMDAIWAPTRFVARFVAACGYPGPVTLVPWPQDFGPAPAGEAADAAERSDIPVATLAKMARAGGSASWASVPLDELARGRDIYLAIQSLSPRKGLAVLVSEWVRFVRATPGADSLLLLKLGFRHAHGITADVREHFIHLLRRYGVAAGEMVRIGLISQHLDDAAMVRLTGKASVLVSSSYGEGFGGPIVEALINEVPVIASRHTGIADLLPPDYPLQFASEEVHVQLRDLIEIYPPSSSWFVPKPGALSAAFASFAAMPASRRTAAMRAGADHAREFCETSVVGRLIDDAIVKLASGAASR